MGRSEVVEDDEDTFVFPPAWYRHRHARRGSGGMVTFTPHAKARVIVDRGMSRGSDKVLRAPATDPAVARQAFAWWEGKPGATPLGAAAVAAATERGNWRIQAPLLHFADVWIAEHGLRFAAEAATELMALQATAGVRHLRAGETREDYESSLAVDVALRVRHALATASDADYAEVVVALTPYRAGHLYARAATSVLAPTRRDWVAHDIADATAAADQYLAAFLTAAAGTEQDLDALVPVAFMGFAMQSLPFIATIVDGVGAGAAAALFRWLAQAKSDGESQRRLLSALEQLPSDEAMQGLIDRVHQKHVGPVLLDAAERYPVRAMRLLAGSASKRTVAGLLRAHVLAHPELVERVLPQLGPEAARRVETVVEEAASLRVAPLSAVPLLLVDPPWQHRAKPRSSDPLTILPARMPATPGWATPGLLPPVKLRDGSGVLPVEAVTNLVAVFAISRLDTPYAGVDVVKAACDPVSLAEFGWGLFQRWQMSGSPNRDKWVIDTLGLVGDDETVRLLSPLLLAWPGEGGHTKAVTGLTVLAAVGTDVALMHLHGISQRAKFKGLKAAAQQKMDEVAAGLGLSAEQLADRLVPELGLDDDGSMRLDYGPRQFTVGFDEQLRPFVADAAGKRLKALPKPGVRDDDELAPAAYRTFSGLKKDVRTLAADQIRRLERAMVTGRRWTGAEFRQLFVSHPLLWHLVRCLVWGRYDESGALTGALRVAADRSFATGDDGETTVADDAVVGVAHPLQLGDTVPDWVAVFAGYQIRQPFPQLGRPTFTLTGEEAASNRFARFEGVTVPTGRVIGLERRGWQRESVDGGVQFSVELAVRDKRVVVIDLDPGVSLGALDDSPEQKLEHIYLWDGDGSRWDNRSERAPALGELDAITVSEVIRDLTELTA